MTGIATTQSTNEGPFASRKRARAAGRAIAGLAAIVATLSLAGHASAASSISACFTYQGAGVPGLATVLEYQTQYGTWAYLGTPSRTGSDGCAGYTIGTQNLRIRIRAGAALRDGRTIASAVSPYYAQPGSGRYFLGSSPMSFGTLSTPWWDVTSTWLNEMDSPNCYANPTILIACYMRNNNMYANPISFPDSDRDGWWDLADRYPSDSRYR